MNPAKFPIFKRVVPGFLGSLIVAGVITYGRVISQSDLLQKDLPDWTTFGTTKMVLLVIATLLICTAIRPTSSKLRHPGWEELPEYSYWVAVLILAASSLVVIVWPQRSYGLVGEYQLLSILTELAFSTALVLLARTIWQARSTGIGSVVLLSVIWLTMFLILMEEMSWGQNYLRYATPDLFAQNDQGEVNLHNFLTHQFEAAYYSAAVLAFVILPFIWPRDVPGIFDELSIFVPSPAFAVISLPLCGLFFVTWNYAFFQIWFYSGLFVAVFLWHHEEDARHMRIIIVVGLALLLSQIVFLAFGHNMNVLNSLLEVREFAISTAFLAYSYIMFARFRSRAALIPTEDNIDSFDRR